jgi:hypothetical protein
MRELTPYDTGERLEPSAWVSPDRRRPAEDERDRYGKVDFDNDESATIVVIHVERKDGKHTVVIDPMGDSDEIEIIFNGDRMVPVATPEPAPAVSTTRSSDATYGRMANVDEHSHDL